MNSSKNLTILYLIGDRGLDLTRAEGYKVHVLKIISGLRAKGHKVFLLAVSETPSLPEMEDYAIIRHTYLRLFFHRIFPFTGTLNSINVLRQIIKLNKLHHFDVIHERFGLYSYGGILASRLLSIPHVTEMNGPVIEEKKLFSKEIPFVQKLAARLLRRFCLWFTHHTVVVSNNLKTFLTSNHFVTRASGITVLPNAADVPAFNKQFDVPTIKKSLGLEGKFIVAYTGTLQVWYAIEDVISAFPAVIQEIPDACFIIAGAGPAQQKLESLAYRLNISGKVRFLGYIEHHRIPEIISIADVVVAPYKELGMPFFNSAIKIFEYLSSGRPMVASRIGQIAEVLEDQHTALLVTPGSVREIATAIIRLSRDAGLRAFLSVNARKEAQKYSWDKYVEQLALIYEERRTSSPYNRSEGQKSHSQG